MGLPDTDLSHEAFKQRYGPWAVIAGGSEGTGAAFARQLAERGLSLVLIAKDGPLEDTAAAIRRDYGVEVVTAFVDLSTHDAADKIFAATGEREVGLFINNAGADWFGERFLEIDVEGWLALSRVNVDTMLRCVHRFGLGMKARRRGGFIIVNSGACYGGGKYLAIYCGAKAFQLTFSEALWSELRVYGVDVLTLVLGKTDTPGFRRRREGRGVVVDGVGLTSSESVAAQGLARLQAGPVHNIDMTDDQPFNGLSPAERREKVILMEGYAMQGNGYKPETDL